MELIERVAHRLKLRDLRVLDTVVRSKSMARAAAQLNVTQPAVSKAILEMERMLGVRLLDRSRQGIEPTPHGRALLRSAVAIFDDLRQGVREIEFLSDPTVGELRIGAIGPMVAGILPVILDRISRRYPRIVFQVTPFSAGIQQIRELRERNVDLSMGRLVRIRDEEDLAREILFDEPMFVVAGAQSPLVKRRKIDFRELVNEPWILPPADAAVGGYITEMFRAGGLEKSPLGIVCGSIQMQYDMVATGRFLSLFPRSVLHFGIKRMAIKVLPIELPTRLTTQLDPVGITTLRNRTLSPVANLFIECAREVARPLTHKK